MRPCVGGSLNRLICECAEEKESLSARALKVHTCHTVTHAPQVVQGLKLWRQTAMNAKELLVHDCAKRQCAKGLHALVVDHFRIFVFAWGRSDKVSLCHSESMQAH
jgi:hypothetical protein